MKRSSTTDNRKLKTILYLCSGIKVYKAMATIDKATSDKISFITYIVPAFAEAYKMEVQDAYFYLKKYGGWDFLTEHWWALHTDNDIWAVRDIYEICYQNGGLK